MIDRIVVSDTTPTRYSPLTSVLIPLEGDEFFGMNADYYFYANHYRGPVYEFTLPPDPYPHLRIIGNNHEDYHTHSVICTEDNAIKVCLNNDLVDTDVIYIAGYSGATVKFDDIPSVKEKYKEVTKDNYIKVIKDLPRCIVEDINRQNANELYLPTEDNRVYHLTYNISSLCFKVVMKNSHFKLNTTY